MKLITSFFKNDDKTLNDFYLNELLPFWFKQNSQYINIDDIFIYTDVNIPLNINQIKISKSDAILHKNSKFINIMSTQVGVWYNMINELLTENEVCIYMDPDAFMLNDKLVKYSSTIKNHNLTKKRIPYFCSDAGISCFRKTADTKKMIENIKNEYLKCPQERCIIEYTYDKLYKGVSECFISWRDVNIQLRGVNLSNRDDIDCIHGVDINQSRADLYQHEIDNNFYNILMKKEEYRKYIY